MALVEAFLKLASDDRAISGLEYALLLSLVGAGILAAILGLSEQASVPYDDGREALVTAGSG